MVTWGPYSVPAYAPTGSGDMIDIIRRDGIRTLYRNQPYAEWYLNSLRIEGSPVERHHASTYGVEYRYDRFASEFDSGLASWDPDSWAELFRAAGARYVVLITKHCDGFLMWPSGTPHPRKAGWSASRDVVGELASAVRKRGMRMGLYYSGALDWSFTSRPMRDAADLIASGPATREYASYVEAHWRELIDRYEPSVLWSDIGTPPGVDLPGLFSYYYDRVPEGVVNDRWAQVPRAARMVVRSAPGRLITGFVAKRMILAGKAAPAVPYCDFVTPEYLAPGRAGGVKWECVRGIGRSFSYNAAEPEGDYATAAELVRLLVDVVSRNGNLLLGVGPAAGGLIPGIQEERLLDLGRWLAVNGEAVFETRPWRKARGATRDGLEVRFTTARDTLYVTVLGRPPREGLAVRLLRPPDNATVRLLGGSGFLDWRVEGSDLVIEAAEFPRDTPAVALAVSPPPLDAQR